jgi:hypothetical protein
MAQMAVTSLVAGSIPAGIRKDSVAQWESTIMAALDFSSAFSFVGGEAQGYFLQRNKTLSAHSPTFLFAGGAESGYFTNETSGDRCRPSNRHSWLTFSPAFNLRTSERIRP